MTFAILAATAAAMISLALIAARPAERPVRVRVRDRDHRDPRQLRR